MNLPRFYDPLWYAPVGAILGGGVGLVVAFVLLGLIVSGGGAAQGIADMDVSYPFKLCGTTGAFVGGSIGWFWWLKKISEPPIAKGVGAPVDLL